ncbi:MAG TPA: SWIM zinc finger family protein [Gemmataceae bacterium]|jgi:hypothetical protein
MTGLPSPARPITRKPVRTIRWLDPAGHTVFAICETKAGTRTPAYTVEDVYTVTELESPLGRAFHLVKHGPRGGTPDTEHDVLLAEDGCRCDCRGFEHYGHCRHVEGLTALLARGAGPAGRHQPASVAAAA